MEQYDVTCPICGTLNKGLFLDEKLTKFLIIFS